MWLRSVLSHRQLSAVLLDLENLVLGKNTISFEGYVAQLYTLTFSELMLLTVMAYDRYLAICQPLCYVAVMSKETCGWPLFSRSSPSAALCLSSKAACCVLWRCPVESASSATWAGYLSKDGGYL